MKLFYVMLILVVVQVSIMFFDLGLSGGGYNLDPYNASTEFNNTENVVWDFVTNPTGWEDTGLLRYLSTFILVGGAITVGVYLVVRNDMVLLAGLGLLFLGFGSIPIISLYNMMNRNIAFFGCTATPCVPGIFAWVITGGLLSLAYVMAVLEFWTGRQTS